MDGKNGTEALPVIILNGIHLVGASQSWNSLPKDSLPILDLEPI